MHVPIQKSVDDIRQLFEQMAIVGDLAMRRAMREAFHEPGNHRVPPDLLDCGYTLMRCEASVWL